MNIRRLIFFCNAAVVMFILCSCGNSIKISKDFFAMDTIMRIELYGENSNIAEKAIKAAEDEIRRLEKELSRDGDGSIGYLNRTGEAVLTSEFNRLIRRSININAMTYGAFDITLAPVTDVWGFYDDEYNVPEQEEIKAALECTGVEKIQLSESNTVLLDNTEIDLGAVGKGYAAECVNNVLDNYGVESAMISLGGNVSVKGKKPDGSDWKIGIKNPENEAEYIGYVMVTDCSVVTSGGYERFFEDNGVKYHHIIDPSSGCPAQNGVLSATVISDDDTLADALSTALFVMGKEKASQLYKKTGGFEYVLVEENGNIVLSDGISNRFVRT